MKLEVGMYVRTKNGIFKIIKITKDLAYWKHEKRVIQLDRNVPEYNYRFSFYKDENIFKGANFKDNIIDLIEKGDYVNGYKVSFKGDDYQPFVQCDYPVEEGSTNHYRFYEKAIYSIVTKEQFESIKYEVE